MKKERACPAAPLASLALMNGGGGFADERATRSRRRVAQRRHLRHAGDGWSTTLRRGATRAAQRRHTVSACPPACARESASSSRTCAPACGKEWVMIMWIEPEQLEGACGAPPGRQ